jgi:hypothetical protein
VFRDSWWGVCVTVVGENAAGVTKATGLETIFYYEFVCARDSNELAEAIVNQIRRQWGRSICPRWTHLQEDPFDIADRIGCSAIKAVNKGWQQEVVVRSP